MTSYAHHVSNAGSMLGKGLAKREREIQCGWKEAEDSGVHNKSGAHVVYSGRCIMSLFLGTNLEADRLAATLVVNICLSGRMRVHLHCIHQSSLRKNRLIRGG